jgi:hypothetical protein
MRNFSIDYHLIVLAFVVLAWLGRLTVQFFRWAGRQMQTSPPSQAQPPAQRLPTRAPALAPPRPMPRQPQAGGPAVPREATERDFRRQEDDLAAWETAALGSPLQSPAPAIVPVKKLFGSSDDLVRAIILREALGPPLSRRRSPGAPRPPAPS